MVIEGRRVAGLDIELDLAVIGVVREYTVDLDTLGELAVCLKEGLDIFAFNDYADDLGLVGGVGID